MALLQIGTDFQLNATQMGLLVSLQYVCIIVIPLLVGVLADRAGKKRTVLGTQAVYCLGCAMACAASGFKTMGAALVLTGAGYGAIQALSGAVLADLYGERCGQYQNLSQCLFGLAAFAGPMLMQSGSLNWKSVFAVAGIGVLASMAILGLWESAPASQSAAERRQTDGAGAYKGILRRLGFLLVCMIICVSLENGATYFSGPFFAERGWSTVYSGRALSAFWLMVTGVRFLFSRIAVRPLKAVYMLLGAACVSVLLLCFADSAWAGVVLFGLIGGCIAALGPLLISEAAVRCPERTGAAASLMVSASGIGSTAMPAVMGLMADHMSVRTAYGVIAAAAAVGCALTLLSYRGQKNSAA